MSCIKINRSLPWSCRIPDFSPKGKRETLPLSLRKHRKEHCLASTQATTRSQVNEECRSQIEGNESKVRRCQRALGENLVPDQTILGHPLLPSHLILYNTYPLCLLQCYCFLLSADSQEMLLPTFVIVKSVSSDNLCRTWTTLVCCCYLKKCNFLTLIFQVCQEYLPLAGETRERYCRSLDR